MNLKVVNENGGRPSISQFLIRWMIRDIWFLLLLQLGVSMSYVGNRGRRDLSCLICTRLFHYRNCIGCFFQKRTAYRRYTGTYHIDKDQFQSSIEETVFQEVADSYNPVFPQIMQLSDKDINAIKSILETAKKKGDFNMAATAM